MWKPIAGYEGLYEVSDDGRVRSLSRTTGKEATILRQNFSGKGYYAVALCKNGIARTVYVHLLVANAFVDKPDVSHRLVVNHKDGDKTNNCANNLEWVSYSENNSHAYNTGLKQKGALFYNAKLSDSQVAEIKANGKCTTYEAIAQKYGVTKATIRDILIGKTWA